MDSAPFPAPRRVPSLLSLEIPKAQPTWSSSLSTAHSRVRTRTRGRRPAENSRGTAQRPRELGSARPRRTPTYSLDGCGASVSKPGVCRGCDNGGNTLHILCGVTVGPAPCWGGTLKPWITEHSAPEYPVSHGSGGRQPMHNSHKSYELPVNKFSKHGGSLNQTVKFYQ